MTEPSSGLREFAARLARGPAFLLLGQNSELVANSPSVVYRWSGVYTSKTEDSVAGKFRADWRTATPVGAMSSVPSRSQTDLQVRYLFGGKGLPPGETPPTDALEEADARLRCIQELSRLASETITPKGVLIIEGWLPGEKLSPADIVPALRQLGPGQAHLFSGQAWSGDPFVQSLESAGQLVIHRSSLDDALQELDDAGSLLGGQPEGDRDNQHVIALGDGFVPIDIHTWNQVRRSARPVDLELLTPPVFSSDAARYQEFRSFVGATEGSPRWRGIAAGMNIRRDYERQLEAQVDRALRERDLARPIVVQGQTATGKSIALAALATDLARAGSVAVLHQSRRTARPTLDDIDMYAAWAEDRGATATVLIWDGMVDLDEYSTLWRQLRSRGRKVLIVGSAYLTQSESSELISAPAELSESESRSLQALLKTFDVQVAIPKSLDASFLGFLYHALPESHSVLRKGLANEMRAAEKGIAKLVRQRGANASNADRLSAMAQALQAAGFSLDALLPGPEGDETPLSELTFKERSSIQKVTTLVLVAGRHGVPVPIDLALRLLGREGSQSIRDALNSFDIIREIDDDDGELFLGVRSHLEAELLAQHEITMPVEIEVVVEAIRNVRISEGYSGAADEVQFVVSLLDRMSPKLERVNSPGNTAGYRTYYGEIADALRERRSETGIAHPRLVLQESKFARGYVHWRQDVGRGTAEDRIADLEHNRDLLEEVLGDQTLSGMMCLALSVELAATLGAVMHEMAESPDSATTSGLAGRLDDVLRAVLQARAIDPGNLHPIDVLAWSTRDAIKANVLPPGDRLDRLASAVATLDTIDRTPLSQGERAKLDRRSAELNKLLGDDEAVWANLRELERNSDPAATFFLAKFEAENGPAGEAAALTRLRAAPLETKRDWRCAQMLLDLSWKQMAGQRLLSGERVPIYLSEENRRDLAELAIELDGAELPDLYKLVFVEAIAQFVSGDYVGARNKFREVEQLTRQLSKRIHTLILLADQSGEPRIFTGRVEWTRNRAGEVWVNELGTKVAFEPHLFSATRELKRHEPLPAFLIGFKLTRGAVAEPRNMYRDQRSR